MADRRLEGSFALFKDSLTGKILSVNPKRMGGRLARGNTYAEMEYAFRSQSGLTNTARFKCVRLSARIAGSGDKFRYLNENGTWGKELAPRRSYRKIDVDRKKIDPGQDSLFGDDHA